MHLDPEVGKAAFRLSLWIIVLAGGMLFFLTPGSAQFAITVFTLMIGVVFVGLVTIVVRLLSH